LKFVLNKAFRNFGPRPNAQLLRCRLFLAKLITINRSFARLQFTVIGSRIYILGEIALQHKLHNTLILIFSCLQYNYTR